MRNEIRSPSAGGWQGKSVFIVDDSEKIRAELSESFNNLGLRVLGHACNGLECLTVLTQMQQLPDLISMDIIMPELNGIDCYRKLRSLGYTMPCLIVSCLASEPRVNQAFGDEIPPFLFLGKPIKVGDLEDRLSRIFGSSGTAVVTPPTRDLEEEVSIP